MDAQAEKFGNPKCHDCKNPKKLKQCTLKWSGIRQRIALCMREINLRFEINL
jgi:hypothetical protein